MASSRYVVDIDVNMYNSNSNGQFPLFGEAAVSLNLENSQNSILHHSFVEEIKSAGPELQQLALDSGLLTEKGSIPTLLSVPSSVPPPAPVVSRDAEDASEFHDESSASYTSPVKRGRGKVRTVQSSSSKRR
jgi:hypothetical protein